METVFWGGLAVVAVGLVVLAHVIVRRPSVEDLEPASSQWIAEQRARQSEDAS